MAWNDSGNKDPWSGKQQPPDLEEALKKLQKKLSALLFGKKKFSEGVYQFKSKNQGPGSPSFLAGGIGFVLFIFWLLSGIFIVQPAEQAAILRFGKYINSRPWPTLDSIYH